MMLKKIRNNSIAADTHGHMTRIHILQKIFFQTGRFMYIKVQFATVIKQYQQYWYNKNKL